MWIEEVTTKSKGTRYKYSERFNVDGKEVKLSVTLNSNSNHAKKEATRRLHDKIKSLTTHTKESNKATFYNWSERWLAYKALTVKRTTYRSIENYVAIVKGHIQEHELLAKIPPIRYEEIALELYHQKNYSYQYSRYILQTVKAIYRYARKYKAIGDTYEYEQMELIRKPISVDDVAKKRNKFLEADELKAVLSELKEKNKRIGLAMEFLSLTGLRCGEMLALRTEDYDKEAKAIHINGTIVQGESVKADTLRGTPKNAYSIRTVALDDRSSTILNWFIADNRRYKEWFMGYVDNGYIFTTMRGKPYNLQFIGRLLRSLSSDKHITTHIFRHTHISMLADMGVPIKAIMERVGHNDPKTTLSIYTHVTTSMQDEIVKKLNAR